MARRAFSVVELLVVLALLTALVSLAMPALLGRVGGAAMEAAARQVGAAVDAARSEAHRTGRPVRLEGRRDPGGEVLLWIVPSGDAASEEETDAAPSEGEMWGALPERVRLSASPELSEEEPATGPPEVGPVIVGTFLPDGNIAAAGPLFVVGDAGSLRVRINGWTGAVTFEEAGGDEAGASADEDVVIEESPGTPVVEEPESSGSAR